MNYNWIYAGPGQNTVLYLECFMSMSAIYLHIDKLKGRLGKGREENFYMIFSP